MRIRLYILGSETQNLNPRTHLGKRVGHDLGELNRAKFTPIMNVSSRSEDSNTSHLEPLLRRASITKFVFPVCHKIVYPPLILTFRRLFHIPIESEDISHVAEINSFFFWVPPGPDKCIQQPGFVLMNHDRWRVTR